MSSKWDKIEVKISLIHNAMFGSSVIPVYIITSDSKYIATVRDEKYAELILNSIRQDNPGMEIIVVKN